MKNIKEFVFLMLTAASMPNLLQSGVMFHNDSGQVIWLRTIGGSLQWPGNDGYYRLAPGAPANNFDPNGRAYVEIYDPCTDKLLSSSLFTSSGGDVHYSIDQDGFIYYNKITHPNVKCPWRNASNITLGSCKLW